MKDFLRRLLAFVNWFGGGVDWDAEWTAMHERHAAIGWRCLKCPDWTTEAR